MHHHAANTDLNIVIILMQKETVVKILLTYHVLYHDQFRSHGVHRKCFEKPLP